MSRKLDSMDYSSGCGCCHHPHWRPTERAVDRVLVCCNPVLAADREIPVGTTRAPVWCPCGLGTDIVEERARLVELGAVPREDPTVRLAELQSLAIDVLGLELIEGELWVGEDAGGDVVVGVKLDDGNTTRLGPDGARVRLWREVR